MRPQNKAKPIARKNGEARARESDMRPAAEEAERGTTAAVEKALLILHGTIDIDSFWIAVQGVVEAAVRKSFVGLTLQNNPVLALTTQSNGQIPAGAFDYNTLNLYLDENPRAESVHTRELFPTRSKLLKSWFYRQYMAPVKCVYALFFFFWGSPRLICVITVMRTAKDGDFSAKESQLLAQLYPQFRTALQRLRSLERGHAARAALEEFLARLPLPTLLLRWDLKVIYQNSAARDFCELWEKGPAMARVMKPNAPVPEGILDGCRLLKRRWTDSSHLEGPRPGMKPEMVHHPEHDYLRATVTLKQPPSSGVTRPSFLIECEELGHAGHAVETVSATRLPHLARLTKREQELTRLVCEGRSNQETADAAGLSVAMVKKHLHSIFRKLEVNSRSRLMTLMR
jgi:DNA-binding CsgD family transcriptional regulator